MTVPALDVLDQPRRRLLKGDYEGHPFRGNQWMDANGVSRGGAGSSPDQDKQAYDLRAAGKSWEEIAKIMGYANGGSVRRLAMRHEARLKKPDGEVVPPPPPPPKPDETEQERGGAIASLADPTSVRAARRLLRETFGENGVVQTLQAALASRGAGAELSPEEREVLSNIKDVGALLDAAIAAEVARAVAGDTPERAQERAKLVSELERVRDVLRSVEDETDEALNKAGNKALTGSSQQTRFGQAVTAQRLTEVVARARTLADTLAPDETTAVGALPPDFDLETLDEANQGGNDPLAADVKRLVPWRLNTQIIGTTPRAAELLMALGVRQGRGSEGGIVGAQATTRERLLLGDVDRVYGRATDIARTILSEIKDGTLTVEQAAALTDDQIADRGIRTWFSGGLTDIAKREEDELRGKDRVIARLPDRADYNTDLDWNEAQPVSEPVQLQRDYALLPAAARVKLAASIVRDVVTNPDFMRAAQRSSEVMTTRDILVPAELAPKLAIGREVRDGNVVIPAGSRSRDLRTALNYLSTPAEGDARENAVKRTEATLRVLKAAGVAFADPEKVAIAVEREGRTRRGGAWQNGGPETRGDVLQDYTEAVKSIVPFLPRALVDGSMSGTIRQGFRGGGELKITTVSSSGVRRAHAENRGLDNEGRNTVVVRQPRPTRNKQGNLFDSDRSTMLHEVGHGVEYANPWVRYVEHLTWTERRGSEPIKTLNAIAGGRAGYRSDEKGVRDEWKNMYAGKTYGGSATSAYEIFTTGLQAVFFNDQAADPEHRAVVLGILAASGAKP